MKKLLEALNEQQYAAVTTTEGPVMVMAGAGSGKTRVLAHRIAYLIDEIGISPSSILAVTFTNKAAREMKTRVCSLIKTSSGIDSMWISTFHGFGVRFLRREIEVLGKQSRRFTIIDDDETLKILKELVKVEDCPYEAKGVREVISLWKNNETPPSRIPEYHLPLMERLIDAYNEFLVKNDLLDFDDLILLPLRILEQYKSVKEKYQKIFQYVLVDEFQDTNITQYRLVRHLTNENSNIFIVGDQDQSIYSFRGARVENINHFQKDYKDTKVILLERNYRSTNTILTLANRIISKNRNRIKKSLVPSKLEDSKACFYRADSSYGEVVFICDQINKYLKDGYSYDDIAIIYRVNAISRSFEDEFLRRRIPYVIYGGTSFYSRKEVKDILAYLYLIMDFKRDYFLERIVNVPKRKLGDSAINKLKKIALSHNISLFEAIDYSDNKSLVDFKNMILSLEVMLHEAPSLQDFLTKLYSETGYSQMLIVKEEHERLENINELKSVMKEIEEASEGDKIEILKDFLDDVTLKTDTDNVAEENGKIKLMSYHQAKGLEYPIVFLVAFERGIFPSQRAFTQSEFEEEIRICYVGITRAEEKLWFTCASSRRLYGHDAPALQSPFMEYLADPNLIDTQGHNYFFGDIHKADDRSDFVEKKNAGGRFTTGDKVAHKAFGNGVVVACSGETITVAFSVEFGIKQLLANHPSLTKIHKEKNNTDCK